MVSRPHWEYFKEEYFKKCETVDVSDKLAEKFKEENKMTQVIPTVQIFGNKGNTTEQIVVGEIRNGNEYASWRTHTSIYRIYDAFTISTSVLKQLADKGIEKITLIYTTEENNTILYKTTVSKFVLNGTRKIDNMEDRYLLARSFFDTELIRNLEQR